MAPARFGESTIRGFSLLEVLVVMGLIALLVGILVPALGAAKRHAQTVECATRMRQLAVATEIYADGNNGFYPPRNGGDPTVAFVESGVTTGGAGSYSDQILLPPLRQARDQIWPIAVSSNLRQIGITVAHYDSDEVGYLPGFVCPGDPEPTPPMSATERFVPWYTSFVFNGFNDFRYDRQRYYQWTPADTTAMRRDEIKIPSAMALFGEKKSGAASAKLYVDIYGRNAYAPLNILDQDRHQGGFSNVAFGDASTRTFAPPGTLSPQNLWAVREENRFEWVLKDR